MAAIKRLSRKVRRNGLERRLLQKRITRYVPAFGVGTLVMPELDSWRALA